MFWLSAGFGLLPASGLGELSPSPGLRGAPGRGVPHAKRARAPHARCVPLAEPLAAAGREGWGRVPVLLLMQRSRFSFCFSRRLLPCSWQIGSCVSSPRVPPLGSRRGEAAAGGRERAEGLSCALRGEAGAGSGRRAAPSPLRCCLQMMQLLPPPRRLRTQRLLHLRCETVSPIWAAVPAPRPHRSPALLGLAAAVRAGARGSPPWPGPSLSRQQRFPSRRRWRPNASPARRACPVAQPGCWRAPGAQRGQRGRGGTGTLALALLLSCQTSPNCGFVRSWPQTPAPHDLSQVSA